MERRTDVLMIRLQFTVRVSNAKLEECLPNWNALKSISVATLVSHFWKIFWKSWKRAAVEKLLSQWTAIKKWSSDKFRHTNNEKQPCIYKSRNSAEVIAKSLSNGDGYDDEENIFENGVQEGSLFSSDPE